MPTVLFIAALVLATIGVAGIDIQRDRKGRVWPYALTLGAGVAVFAAAVV